MDKAFDLRVSGDREALAELLPIIYDRSLSVPKTTFVQALADLAMFLENPDWMVYQWGAFQPIRCGRAWLVLGLEAAVDLGIQLRRLSPYKGFDRLLSRLGPD